MAGAPLREIRGPAASDPARFGSHRELAKPFDLDELVATVRALIGPA